MAAASSASDARIPSSSASAVTAASSSSSSSSLSSPRSRRPPATDPYDLPRPTSSLPIPNPLSYASGGQETDFQDEGDLGARAITKADKGKGRAQEPGERYGKVERGGGDGPGPDDAEEGEGEGEGDEVDEAAEERKVQENLARWSRAEQKRRASIRRSSQFVTPSLPPLPSAPPVPSASTIMRRTSTLVRKASRGRRRRKGASVVGLGLGEGEQLELSGEMQGGGVAARRGRRKLSVKIAQGRDGSRERSSVVTLSEVGEAPANDLDDGDEDALRTPTASTMPTPNLPSSVASSTTTAPTPSNASFASLSRMTSRFVEDLPPSLSATSSRASLQLQSGGLSPTSPTAVAGRANPFSDAVVIPSPPGPHAPPQPPRPAPASELDLPARGVRPPAPRSSPSQQSVQTFASSTVAPSTWTATTEPSYDAYDAYNETATRPLAASAAYDSASPGSPAMRPHGGHRQPLRRRSDDVGRDGGSEDEDEDEEEEEEPPTVGLLDWLLCGCFRPQGWDRPRGEGGAARYEQQEGRTNPME
ncbi:hypothetical protein JCM1841_000510 [Sporobolomyces salmonicolor]